MLGAYVSSVGDSKNAGSAPHCPACCQLMTPHVSVPGQRRRSGTPPGMGFRRPQLPPRYVCWNDDCLEFGICTTLAAIADLPFIDAD